MDSPARVPATARSQRAVWVVLVAAMIWGHLDGSAHSAFTSTPSPPSMSISSATLAAASGAAAANQNCVPLTSTQVSVTWTASSSSFADGYEIFRSLVSGGPYTSVGTASGGSTTTWTDTSVVFVTTYYYVVQATKINWRSSNSNQASVTTPTILCA